VLFHASEAHTVHAACGLKGMSKAVCFIGRGGASISTALVWPISHAVVLGTPAAQPSIFITSLPSYSTSALAVRLSALIAA
jgi:hypothetical protein